MNSVCSASHSIETTNIGTLLEFSTRDTLILSDITDTLYRPCNTMSDKKWRVYFSQRVREVIPDPDLAAKIANKVENLIVNRVDKKLVHLNAPAVIKELQAKQIPILAISMKSWSTPYDTNFGITTSAHLKKLDIDLERPVPLIGRMKSEGTMQYEDIAEIQTTAEYTFAKGIIFTNKKPLDQALDAFLRRLERKPRQIIILENSHEHQEKLETVIKAHDIALTYIRHKRTETHEPFDPTLGTIEFLKFMESSNVIQDDEAKTIKESNSSLDYEALLKRFIAEARMD